MSKENKSVDFYEKLSKIANLIIAQKKATQIDLPVLREAFLYLAL